MRWVGIVIRPARVDEVVAALDAIGVARLTLTQVQGWIEHPHHPYADEAEDFPDHRPAFEPHVRIEIAVADEHLRQVVDTVLHCACADRTGDGEITVTRLAAAVRIRTGESGEAAL